MTAITQDEAAEKWCPMVRTHEEAGIKDLPKMYANNRPHALQGMTCIGSKCMAWRWAEEIPDIDDNKFAPKVHIPDLTEDDWNALEKSKAEPPRPPEVKKAWVWFPCVIDAKSGDYDGGYWEEPEGVREDLHAQAVFACRGYCGHFGKPDA